MTPFSTPCTMWHSLDILLTFFCAFKNIFTALHGMQARSSDENSVYPSVCLSICLSVRRMNCNKTDFISYERTFSLVFFEKKEWLVEGDPFYMKFCINRPRWSKIADFEQIIARSTSTVTSSEKVQLTLIGSPLRAFQ